MPTTLIAADYNAGMPGAFSADSAAVTLGEVYPNANAPWGGWKGGRVRTNANINGAGMSTVSATSGASIVEYQMRLETPTWITTTTLASQGSFGILDSYNSGWLFVLAPIAGVPAARFRFGAALTTGGMLSFVVDLWQATAYVGGNASAAAFAVSAGGTVTFRVRVETTSSNVTCTFWTGITQWHSHSWPASQIMTMLGLSGDVRLATLYPAIELWERIPAVAPTAWTEMRHDDLLITDMVVGPVMVPTTPGAAGTIPSPPPTYTTASMAAPVAVAEAVLSTLAGTLVANAENDAGASTLTVQPSYTLQVADGYQTTEHPYDAGYFASSSQTSKRRRSWGFQWRALNATQFTTLLALAVAVEGKRTSFLWTDPETAEVIRLRFLADLQYQQIAGTGAQAVYAASASVEEVHA